MSKCWHFHKNGKRVWGKGHTYVINDLDVQSRSTGSLPRKIDINAQINLASQWDVSAPRGRELMLVWTTNA
jgi:hypothetical protein